MLIKTILDLCGGSGAWSQPYAQTPGYHVVIVDLKTTGDDVRTFQCDGQVHGILAAPPCQHLALSGARWWKSKGQSALLDSLAIVDACFRIITLTQPQWWALENPTGRLRKYLGPPTMSFHPNDFGDPYTKATHLWGNFTIPEKSYTEPTLGSMIRQISGRPHWKCVRNQTAMGFAQAFFEANP